MPLGLTEDEKLFSAYKEGSAQAFLALYEQYKQPVFGYVLKNVRQEQLAEELFQDVWLRVIASASRYKNQGRFRQWLFTCAHNVIVDHFRRQKVRADELRDTEVEANNAEHSGELTDRIELASRELPMEQRQAFYVREYLVCSLKEIAQIQGCSLEAAKSRMRYDYRKLRILLNDLNEPE